jgi:hypothetical protein
MVNLLAVYVPGTFTEFFEENTTIPIPTPSHDTLKYYKNLSNCNQKIKLSLLQSIILRIKKLSILTVRKEPMMQIN